MRQFLIFAISLFLLAGCANISSLLSTPEPATASTSTPAPVTTSTFTPTPTPAPGGPRTLRIWIPPQFDPAAETPAGTILQERLDEFVSLRPGLQIEVRVKAESMVNGLSTTQAAAPAVMPDLMALSRTDLEAATDKGLLHPLDGLTTLPDDPDWYPYAQQVGQIQNTTFGLPFAGDALALFGYNYPLPADWNELPEETFIIFPAADPQGLFGTLLYLSAGGELVNNQGLPAVDETILAEVLSLYLPQIKEEGNEEDEEEIQYFSPISGEYQSDEQAWNVFRERRGNLTVSWVSNYLDEQIPTLALGPVPGLGTDQFTLATGWSWALAGSNPENQPLAVELAEFLSDSGFLAEWTQAAGYLPTRPTALSSWNDAISKFGLTQVAESAYLVPNDELLNTIGPLIAEATLSVLNGEQLPAEAAQTVAEQIK